MTVSHKVALVAAALGVISVSGCSSSTEGSPSVESTAPPSLTIAIPTVPADQIPSGRPHTLDQDNLFLAMLIDPVGMPETSNPDHRISLGLKACDAFDQGKSLESVGRKLMNDEGWSPTHTGGFLAASVVIYCPEHENVKKQDG